jgi:hypothetical protein
MYNVYVKQLILEIDLAVAMSRSVLCLNLIIFVDDKMPNDMTELVLATKWMYCTSGVIFFIDYCTALRDT